MILFVVLLLIGFAHGCRNINTGMNIDPYNPTGKPTVGELQNLGVEYVRIEFKDGSSSPTPSTFTFYDPIIQNYINNGIKVMLILDYSTFPGKPDWKSTYDQFLPYSNNFVERVGKISSHYNGIVNSYEIWNEPDLLKDMPGYNPGIQASIFGPLFQLPSYKIIKSNDPNAKVYIGGLASGDINYLEKLIQSTSNTFYGDYVSLHPYGRRPSSNWPSSTWGFGEITPFLESYNDILVKYGKNNSIMISEMGTNDVNVQDEFPFRFYTAVDGIKNDMAKKRMVDVIFWFCWSDGMVSPFGVVDANGKKKKSYFSYQQYANQTLC